MSTAGDSLAYSNGIGFTTADQDNDIYGVTNCAVKYSAPFWMKQCYLANLLGLNRNRYLGSGELAYGVVWHAPFGHRNSLFHARHAMRKQTRLVCFLMLWIFFLQDAGSASRFLLPCTTPNV